MERNIEVSTLLVQLYADFKLSRGDDRDYAEAVARAIAALTMEDEK